MYGRLYKSNFNIYALFNLKYNQSNKMKMMKTMTISVIVIFLTFAIACSKGDVAEVTNDELVAANLTYSPVQETNYLNGAELFKHAAIAEQLKVRNQIASLTEAIRAGKKHLLPQLEAAQKKEASIEASKAGISMIRLPKVPYPPRPPRGCFEDPQTNCGVPKINLSEYGGIQITDEMESTRIEILDSKNKIVGKSAGISSTKGGMKVLLLKSELKGKGTLRIRPDGRIADKSLYLDLPVFKE
ncbi:MAG: hypothetical protein CMP77_14190 [Flavobacterium sp.]|nr:hypothetical protein [Flavobacterium sp.]